MKPETYLLSGGRKGRMRPFAGLRLSAARVPHQLLADPQTYIPLEKARRALLNGTWVYGSASIW